MKNQKIIFSIYLALFILSISIFAREDDDDFAIELEKTFNATRAIKDQGSARFSTVVDSKTIIDELGFGWNLGNTFDA